MYPGVVFYNSQIFHGIIMSYVWCQTSTALDQIVYFYHNYRGARIVRGNNQSGKRDGLSEFLKLPTTDVKNMEKFK